MNRSATILLATALLAAPSMARAQDQPNMQQWEGYLERAAEAFDEGDYESALLLYGRARSIYDPPRLQYNVARIHESLGECTAAKILYVELVEDDEADEALRKRAGTQLEALASCGPPKDAESSDKSGSSGDDEPETSEPTTEFVRRGGGEAMQQPRAPASPGRRAATWTFVGLGSVSIVGGFTVLSGLLVPTWARECHYQGMCAQHADDDETIADVDDAASRVVRTHGLAGVTLLGVGLGSIATGLIVHLTRPKTTVSLWCSPTRNGVALGGKF